MNPTIFFSVCSIFYCVLLIVTLYSRREKNTMENKILKILAFVNLGNLFCEAIGMFLGNNYESYKLLNDIMLRLMLVFYVVWFSFFMAFVLNVSKQEQKFTFKKNYPVYIMMIIVSILVAIPAVSLNPVTNKSGVIIYSTGMAVQIDYYYAMLCEMLSLVIMFKNIKNTKITHYTSLFILIIFSTLAAAIQSYYPSILLTASTETFVLYVAYINVRNKQIKKGDNNV